LANARSANAPQNLFAEYGICLSDSKTHALRSPAPGGSVAAFGVMEKFWKSEDLTNGCLTIGFLDGSDKDHAIVKSKVVEWLQYPDPIGLRFLFVDPSNYDATDNANVRISFVRNNQSYSYVGKDCQTIPVGRETMHLGWDVSTPYGKATILHEFGHALGLFHEHQSPFGAQKKIHWVPDVVIDDCLRSQGWTEEETRAQIINVEPLTRSTIGTTYDPKSIMHYRFPETWTEEHYNQPANLTLSVLDKTFIRQMYPTEPRASSNVSNLSTTSSVEQKSNTGAAGNGKKKHIGQPAAH
jgi:hypothetical protein